MHTRGIFFRRLRSKPSLTEQDNQDRLAFAAEFGLKESAWWCQIIHMHVKHFPVSLHGDARLSAAREGVRGAYGTAGEGLDGEHAKRNPKLRYNTGAKGVGVLADVGDGRVLLWQYIDANWRGEVAAQMYAGPVLNTARSSLARANSRSPRKTTLLALSAARLWRPTPFLTKAVGNMRRRCALAVKANGGLFAEGS